MTNKQNLCPIPFHCRATIGEENQEWSGYISRIRNYGSHQEIHVSSRSALTFIIGDYINGTFLSIPDYNVGCGLAHYSDYFWNYECLSRLIRPVDAATIAEALRILDQLKLIEV